MTTDNVFDILKTIIKTDEYGTRSWYVNDYLHRVDGPAVIYADGSTSWYLNGRLHRIGGPAIEYADGLKYWYINGARQSDNYN